MTLWELNAKRDLFRRELKRLDDIETNCHQCDHFMQGKCLKFDAKPPPEFVAKGCEQWEWNGIPF